MSNHSISRRPIRDLVAAIVFLVVVSTACHLLYSWMGYNPTDDGFVLAQSRRLLEGQVPHRDFISIRPVGSAILHAPFVFFGGEYTYWISRLFVWFQFACIAWAWPTVISRFMQRPFSIVEKLLFAFVAFAFSAHYFPVMAWHSIDALFLLSIGLMLCLRNSHGTKLAGYCVMGAACLFRQNFLLMVPVGLAVLGDWRRVRFWVAAAVPGILYGGFVLLFGALPDAIRQMTEQTGLFRVGIARYILTRGGSATASNVHFALVFGCVASYLAVGRVSAPAFTERTSAQRFVGTFTLYAVPFSIAVLLGYGKSAWAPSFGLFGAAAGATVYFAIAEHKRADYLRAGILVLLTAWSTSISTGYRNPSLGSGALAVLLMAYGRVPYRSVSARGGVAKLPVFLAAVVAAVAIVSFATVRRTHVYYDRPARELTQSLDGVLPGGRLIRTNRNTYEFLLDLRVAIEGRPQGKQYAIIPDCAGYWARAEQVNPLPGDWATAGKGTRPGHGGELYGQVERFVGELEARRGDIVVIVQKVAAQPLARELVPLPEGGKYAVVDHVRTHWTKTGETEFFEVYE